MQSSAQDFLLLTIKQNCGGDIGSLQFQRNSNIFFVMGFLLQQIYKQGRVVSLLMMCETFILFTTNIGNIFLKSWRVNDGDSLSTLWSLDSHSSTNIIGIEFCLFKAWKEMDLSISWATDNLTGKIRIMKGQSKKIK